ncbi:MAG: hypothetical protein KA319_12695 [Ferruginibacter sp.]|nr:hypothetical protein [Ferruginibacter sp.]
MNKILSALIVLIIGCKISFSQVVVTNPTNTTPNLAATYTSLANAITDLNSITAISGPVTITLQASNAQTAPIGGYAIQFTATTTATNTITIQGSNNTITAFTPQAAGSLNDAVFKIIGADYVTIADFIIQENAANTNNVAATNNMTEFGIALLRSSATNGAKHNIITNNVISLNRSYRNTFGIYSNVRHSATDVTTASEIINSSGSNSGNKIFANVITNVDFGVVLVGAATTAFMDEENKIGESNDTSGNTITNWGGNSNTLSSYVDVTTDSYAIFSNHQVRDEIFYNTITSAAVNGSSFNVGGILKDYTSGQPCKSHIIR